MKSVMRTHRVQEINEAGPYPWESSESSFAAIRDEERIALILGEGREHRFCLTPVADDGRIFAQIQLVSLISGVLRVDKPLDWDKKITAFQLFFRSGNGLWFGFRVLDFAAHLNTLSFTLPAELCFLQRRQSPRIPLPYGTRAMLRKNGKFISTLFVRDISTAGMLICTGSASFGIDVNAELRDIVIAIPEYGSNPSRTLPPIDNGQVVRSYFEKENNTYCYGVAFHYESPYVREALKRLNPIAG